MTHTSYHSLKFLERDINHFQNENFYHYFVFITLLYFTTLLYFITINQLIFCVQNLAILNVPVTVCLKMKRKRRNVNIKNS